MKIKEKIENNMKLSEIKAELRKMLLQFNLMKTSGGVLQYEDEEMVVGTVVKIVAEDGTEEIPTGEFVTEDNKKLIIENGEVKEIEEIEVQPVEVVEEPTEEETPEEVAEEVVEEAPIEEAPAEEEVVEEPTEEVVEEAPAEDVVPALEARIAELEAQLAEALAKLAELTEKTDEVFSKMEKMSLAKPVMEEFENRKKLDKTGDSKLDKFMKNYGDK